MWAERGAKGAAGDRPPSMDYSRTALRTIREKPVAEFQWPMIEARGSPRGRWHVLDRANNRTVNELNGTSEGLMGVTGQVREFIARELATDGNGLTRADTDLLVERGVLDSTGAAPHPVPRGAVWHSGGRPRAGPRELRHPRADRCLRRPQGRACLALMRGPARPAR